MRTITKYECDKCGYTSPDDKEVMQCEEAHIIPTKIISSRGYEKSLYPAPPQEIVIELSNDTHAVYILTDRPAPA